MVCPEDVDWIFDVDTLESAGGESFRQLHGLSSPSADNPHHPFLLTPDSGSLWDKTVRSLSMASGEAHILLSSSKETDSGPVFYARVAGFREQGMPRIACVFQLIDKASVHTGDDKVWRNWLYLLHEIKNTISLLRVAEDCTTPSSGSEDAFTSPEHLRSFALHCLENHIRNGVLLATDDGRELPCNPAPLHLQAVLENIIDAHAIAMAQKGNSIELDFRCEQLATVRFDRTLLEQLLNNLLLNKSKLLANQKVVVRVEEAAAHSRSGWELVLTLDDQGPVFPDFVLQHKSPEVDIGGLLDVRRSSGLGLSIVRRIVTTLNGQIHFFNGDTHRRIRIHLPIS